MMRFVKTITSAPGVHYGKMTPCLFGISVSDDPTPSERLVAAYTWTTSSFAHTALLIGNSLFRLTLQIQRGLLPDHASEAALLMGECQLRQLVRRLQHVPEIVRTSEVAELREFETALTRLREAFRANPAFRRSVTDDAERYCNRQVKRQRLAIDLSEATSLATDYLLEEIAIYHALVDQGWLVDVHVGKELPTLARFIRGELTGISPALERRMNISLRIRGNKKGDE